MVRFTINVAGEKQLDRAITRFGDGVTDYRPVWPVIYDDFLAECKGQFESEGDQGGKHWEPLSDNPPSHGYATWKAKHYPGKPILEREGNLKKSLTERDAPGAVFTTAPKAMTMGTSIPYAIYHQKGTEEHFVGGVSGSRMPARPIVQLTEKFKREAMRYIQQFLVIRASALGFRTGMSPTQVSSISSAMSKYPGWQPSYMEAS